MVTLVHPLGQRALIEVFAEVRNDGLVVIEDEHRSLQGQIVALGPDVLQRDQGDLHVGDEVLFDDNECPWWRGVVPSYLSAVLDDPAEPEYVLVPCEQILGVIDREEARDDAIAHAGRAAQARQDRDDRAEQARAEAPAVPRMKQVLAIALALWWAVWVSDPPAPTRVLTGPFPTVGACMLFVQAVRPGPDWTFRGCEDIALDI